MKHPALLTLVVALLLATLPALAAEEAAEQALPEVGSFASPTAAPLARLALAVGAISAAGWGLALWARRRSGPRGTSSARIEILANRRLGPRHQISLIEVGGHRLLIGTGSDSITTLADLSADAPFGEELERRLPQPTEDGRRTLLETIGRFEGLDG